MQEDGDAKLVPFPITPAYGRYALALLFAVNLLNYIDRQVLFAVFPLIKTELHLSDTALGFLGSGFMVSYMASAPLLGWFGDRYGRVKLAGMGLSVWSIATAATGMAGRYSTILASRATVGIGEASFGTVSPGLISDYFPKERRGSVLSFFYLAIPVGSAVGYILGGVLGQAFGWHSAFFIVGIPGLALAVPLFLLREPRRGATEKDAKLSVPHPADYVSLFKNRSFVIATLAMAAMTFAMGGLAQWLPTFFYRTHGQSIAAGNALFGTITVISGIAGTLTGGWLGDRFQKGSGKGYLMVSGMGFLAGTPFAVYALVSSSFPGCLTAIFFAEFFLFFNTGPLNTTIVNVTNPSVRAMAFAVNIFFIHALGDAVSPAILGRLSDIWGLRTALLITPFMILLAAGFSFLCTRFVEKDSCGSV
ncbi:MAG: spinster family MFS transporter [Thermodesulfovibrionales bacterium]